VQELRERAGIREEDSKGGDLILGRHTWKEYIRGLHEGWLGPMTRPPDSEIPVVPIEESASATNDQNPQSGTESTEKTDDSKKEEPPKPKPSPTPPYILPANYSSSTASDLPQVFPVSTVLPFPHLLGFLNTPIRMVRFLNRRKLADETGQLVTSFILAEHSQPYSRDSSWEQQEILEGEEQDWHKVARKPNPPEEEGKERPWTEEMVVDDRVGSRMRKPEVYSKPVTETKGHLLEWKGGADPMEKISWGKWFRQAFDMDVEEPKCKGWEDGLKGED
jgi:mitochondrial import inner membrane translocase subunit TIM54